VQFQVVPYIEVIITVLHYRGMHVCSRSSMNGDKRSKTRQAKTLAYYVDRRHCVRPAQLSGSRGQCIKKVKHLWVTVLFVVTRVRSGVSGIRCQLSSLLSPYTVQPNIFIKICFLKRYIQIWKGSVKKSQLHYLNFKTNFPHGPQEILAWAAYDTWAVCCVGLPYVMC
jgi:hypothetical protein